MKTTTQYELTGHLSTIIKVGAIKLSEIAEIIGIPMFSAGKKMDFVKITLNNINTSYKKSMSVSDLEKFMLSGKIESGLKDK